MRCCLGFACTAAGLSDVAIRNKPTPHNLPSVPDSLSGLALICEDSLFGAEYALNTLQDALIVTNDHTELSDTEREARLMDYGARAGLAFTFVD
jgi:hypothetical protein